MANAMPDRPMVLFFAIYAGTHYAYPRRDGQAELALVAGNMQRLLPSPALTGLDAG